MVAHVRSARRPSFVLLLSVLLGVLAACGDGTAPAPLTDGGVFDDLGADATLPLADLGPDATRPLTDLGFDADWMVDLGGDAALPVDLGSDADAPSDLGFDDAEIPDLGFDAEVLIDLGFDAGTPDLGFDAGTPDLGFDAGTPDLGFDAGTPDLGVDFGMPDLGVDFGMPDLGFDAGTPDLGFDAGTPDLGFDAGSPDLGMPDMGMSCPDADGDGAADASCGGTDCDDTRAAVRPGATELCNDVDDNCDALVDEGCGCALGEVRACGTDVGRCTVGVQACTGTGYTACTGVGPIVERCNGEDDDCDGFTDEAVPALTSLSVSCGVLAPAFATATTAYTVTAGPGAGSCVVRATAACSALAITVDGVPLGGDGSTSVALTRYAPQPIAITVTSSDGATQTYTVTVSRQGAYVKASNTGVLDRFGTSVALSADGNVLAVGAVGEGSNATGVGGDESNNAMPGAGAVYVYRRGAAGWAQEAFVKASNTGSGTFFGSAVALSADGSVLLVGAEAEDSRGVGIDGDQFNFGATSSGSAYLFRRTGGVWAQEVYVKASNADAGDDFGITVSLSADGDTFAVGAPREDASATGIYGDETLDDLSDTGAAYVFQRTAGVWAQEAYIKASNTDFGDRFGGIVSLSGDGATLAVAAVREQSNATGIDGNQSNDSAPSAGAVYVFARTAGVWVQQAYVKASNTWANDAFGGALAISGDGSRMIVGAEEEDSGSSGINGDQGDTATSAGAAYLFQRTAGVWAQEAYVKPLLPSANSRFGHEVAMSGDGLVFVVSATMEDTNGTGLGGRSTGRALDSGAAYVFRFGATGWAEELRVKATNTAAGDFFGVALALSGNGGTLAASSALEDSSATGIGGDQASNAAADSGAVYLY
jgi:hypothetical protein